MRVQVSLQRTSGPGSSQSRLPSRHLGGAVSYLQIVGVNKNWIFPWLIISLTADLTWHTAIDWSSWSSWISCLSCLISSHQTVPIPALSQDLGQHCYGQEWNHICYFPDLILLCWSDTILCVLLRWLIRPPFPKEEIPCLPQFNFLPQFPILQWADVRSLFSDINNSKVCWSVFIISR